MSRTGSSTRCACSTTRANCSRSRSSTTPPTKPRSVAQQAVRRNAAKGVDIKYLHRTDRTGYKAGALEAGHAGGAGPVHRHLRRRLHPHRRLPPPHRAVLRRREDRDGAGALGPHQPGLLAADEDPVDPARRALRARARQPQPRRPLLQLQRHGRHLAARGDHRRRRLAARHAHRRPRPQLPRAAPRLAVRVPAEPGVAGRAAGRDELVQVAAAPLGEGIDPDLPQAAAADPALEHLGAAKRPRRSSTSPPTSTTRSCACCRC